MRLFICSPFANATFTVLSYLLICSFHIQSTDADSAVSEDHNHHRLLDLLDQSDTSQHGPNRESSYEPDFFGLDRGIVGRAPEVVTALANNAPQPMNIQPGEIQYWTFPKISLQAPYANPAFDLPLNLSATSNATCLESELIQLAKKQNTTANTRNVWLSISVCDQPTSTTTGTAGLPPPLGVYLSRSADNQQPDVGSHEQIIAVEGGFGFANLSSVGDAIWIGVRAPLAPDGFEGVYSYELAASIDALYTTYFDGVNDTQITAWDTDSNSSILSTRDITNSLANTTNFFRWMEMDPPFKVYVHDQADLSFRGLSRSICGLKNHAMVTKSVNSMVKIGGQPKQLFYVDGLNRTTSYLAIMTLEPGSRNSTAGGGGTVWKATNFTTKSGMARRCKDCSSTAFVANAVYQIITARSSTNSLSAPMLPTPSPPTQIENPM